MVITIPLHKRPLFQGVFGSVFGISSICGPLIGGVFTTKVSWRWCFYLNLPIGAVVVAVILLILKTPPSNNKDSFKQQFMKLDPWGTAAFLPGIVCLLLALQWGGTTYPWANARIIVLFILAGILLSIFVVLQFRGGEFATVPIHIIKQRSVASGVYFSTLSSGSMMVTIYYLPVWFQAIKDVSAVHSGIDTLPIVMSLVFASVLSGAITAKSGYYTGQLIACSFIMSVGAGMLTTLTPDTNHSKWFAYEFLYGFGLGLGMQQAGMAAQTTLAKKDVMTGVSLMFFFQGIGGSIFISAAQTVFTHSLITKLGSFANITPDMIVKIGATELKNLIPAQFLPQVLIAYNSALSDVFKVGVACASATILCGLTMEWRSVKGLKQGGPEKVQEEIGSRSGEVTEMVVDESPITVLESTPVANEVTKAQ